MDSETTSWLVSSEGVPADFRGGGAKMRRWGPTCGIFLERTNAEAETPILWTPGAKS